MYDMYPWDSASQGDYPPSPLRSWRNPSRKPRDSKSRDTASRDTGSRDTGSRARDISPAQAVQVALDRRDNGGEARAATSPAASQGRQ